MRQSSLITTALLAMVSFATVACSDATEEKTAAATPAAATTAPVAAPALPTDIPEGMGVLPTSVPVPADNPQTAEKVELGKKLYFEPALSTSGNFS